MIHKLGDICERGLKDRLHHRVMLMLRRSSDNIEEKTFIKALLDVFRIKANKT